MLNTKGNLDFSDNGYFLLGTLDKFPYDFNIYRPPPPPNPRKNQDENESSCRREVNYVEISSQESNPSQDEVP